jgi:hypothetical protein
VTDLFMVPIVDELLVGIIVPVQIDGDSRYVVGRTPDQHALARLVAANELPTGWHAVVSDAAHRIISRSEQEGLFIGQELPPAQRRRARPGDVFEFIDSEGQPSLEASARSELTGWETAVWAPKALLEAAVRAQWQTLGVMALLAFVLLVALASWLGRIIARSVGQAARAAIALGEGGPMPPNPRRRSRHADGGASRGRRQATGGRGFAASEQRSPAVCVRCNPARVVAV